jgi:hypothetical protein
MKRLIHFFSLAVLTQITLMLSQLVLLPIQVRLWGQVETAMWYSALALATVTYVVDCGLRTAGHSELMRASTDPVTFSVEAAQFRAIWSWIRLLVLLVTASLVAGDAGFHLLRHSSYPMWRATLICACAMETVLTIRITYLDTLGRYRGAEASYLCFALLRLTLSVPALLIFHCRAAGLAGIYLFAATVVLFGQGYCLCRTNPLLRLLDRYSELPLRTLALSRFTVAEPLANWARLSLPVLIIGQVASPIGVTTYVALRAVFGAGRTTIQQLARVASVEVLKVRDRYDASRADSVLIIFIVAAVFFGSTLGLFVVTDNMRALGLWLRHFDRHTFLEIALAFALTAPFFSYQIPMNLMFRSGELAWVAKRHYLFIFCSSLFAGIALLATSLTFYLTLLVSAELVLSISFFLPGKEKTALSTSHSEKAELLTAAGGSLLILVCWALVRQNLLGLFEATSSWPIFVSYGLALIAICSFAALLFVTYKERFRAIRSVMKADLPSLAVAE